MNKLLNIFLDTILPIIIIFVIMGFGILIYFLTKKNFNKPIIEVRTNKVPLVTLKQSFCTEQEMQFLEALHKSLPREFIAFPNICVSSLIEPKNNMGDYRSVINKFVDVCIFLRNGMKPVLVIDLYEQSPVKQQLKKFDESVKNILNEIKIPILHKEIEEKYDINNLRSLILKTMNSEVVSYLKEQILDNVNKLNNNNN